MGAITWHVSWRVSSAFFEEQSATGLNEFIKLRHAFCICILKSLGLVNTAFVFSSVCLLFWGLFFENILLIRYKEWYIFAIVFHKSWGMLSATEYRIVNTFLFFGVFFKYKHHFWQYISDIFFIICSGETTKNYKGIGLKCKIHWHPSSSVWKRWM